MHALNFSEFYPNEIVGILKSQLANYKLGLVLSTKKGQEEMIISDIMIPFTNCIEDDVFIVVDEVTKSYNLISLNNIKRVIKIKRI